MCKVGLNTDRGVAYSSKCKMTIFVIQIRDIHTSGGGAGMAAPPPRLFLDQTKENFLRHWASPPPPTPYVRVWIQHCIHNLLNLSAILKAGFPRVPSLLSILIKPYYHYARYTEDWQ